MTENFVQKQVRLVLEKQCRELAELLGSKVPAGVGFLLFLADFGEAGNTAYVSSVQREGAIKLVQEWLDKQDVNHPAEGWQTAALFLREVASAIDFKGEPEPEAVLQACRLLADKAYGDPE